jgi:DNA mismatch repair ATPase MutS
MSSKAISNGLVHTLSSSERLSPASFRSVLFAESEVAPGIDAQKAPETFSDLNLDQIVESVTAGRDAYNLKPFFYTPLRDVETVYYRYDVFRDLENKPLAGFFQLFAQEMRRMRANLVQAGKLYYKRQKQSWFLAAVQIYCDAVIHLSHSLMRSDIGSRGLRTFRAYLAIYIDSNDFRALVAETQKVKADLAAIKYSLHILGKRVTVSKYNSEPDYSVDVLETFQKFSQREAKAYEFEYHSTPDMNHVEAAILDLVAKLHPEIFASLDQYCAGYATYSDNTIAKFDREIQFYFAYLEHIQQLRQTGLSFCYPEVSDQSKEVYARETFDLALAVKLNRERSSVVKNDFYLHDPERIFVVSGPNQGGKTTFARTFGQLHYLASTGCPIPGTEARLFLYDKLFTHFEREEDLQNLSGKLEDELRRIHRILERVTSKSILIMNESFLATTLNDALFLSKEMMRRIVELDMLCVSVTFLDELASFSEATVSMVSSVNPHDPASRTFKLVRKPADGLAYAAAIAEKYRLTHDAVRARIALNTRRHVTP